MQMTRKYRGESQALNQANSAEAGKRALNKRRANELLVSVGVLVKNIIKRLDKFSPINNHQTLYGSRYIGII